MGTVRRDGDLLEEGIGRIDVVDDDEAVRTQPLQGIFDVLANLAVG